jgi:endonuclease/exonuclease/phosphatase family metal-dependent hydrolase
MFNRYNLLNFLFIVFLFLIFFSYVIVANPANENDTKMADTDVKPLHVISYNIRNFGPLARTDEGKARIKRVYEDSQVVGRLAMELKLYKPDIVTIQEATPKELIVQLAEEMGMNYTYFPSNWQNDNWPFGIAGALMTRFTIKESQNCPLVNYDKCPEDIFTRHFGRTVIDIESEELVVLSAHLLPGGRENSKDVHEREIKEILAVAEQDRKSGRSILIQGDLNHGPDGFEYKMWTTAGLVDAFESKGSGFVLTSPSDVPRRRIDYIWADGPIAKRLKSCRILFEGGFRTNPDDSASFALSDHIPVFAIFE